jgi:hypothetical protein
VTEKNDDDENRYKIPLDALKLTTSKVTGFHAAQARYTLV